MVRVPAKNTLKKYGLTEEEWVEILKSQGGVCAICKQEPKTGRMVTDHFHVKNWKKMPPEVRKCYVRGICCWWCNSSLLGRGINVFKAKNIVKYLEDFDSKIEQLRQAGVVK